MSTHAPIYDFGIVLEPLLPYLNKSAIELFPDAYALSPETKAICHFSNDKFIKMAESEELPEFFDDFIDDSPLYEILVKNLGSDNIRRIPCFEGEVHTAPDASTVFFGIYESAGNNRRIYENLRKIPSICSERFRFQSSDLYHCRYDISARVMHSCLPHRYDNVSVGLGNNRQIDMRQ